MATLALTRAPARERGAVRLAYQVTLVFAGALLVSGLAQLSIKLPFTPVPITGQTLGVLLVGASLGPSLGLASMVLYLAWGVAGLPVFAPGAHGAHTTGLDAISLATPSAGYLFGFAAAACVVGFLARFGWDRSPRSSISAMLIGEVVIYAFGLPWLMASVHVPLSKALELGLYPFVVGDLLKLFIAAGVLPLAWRLTRRRSNG